jgi:hypothetical protein
MKNGRLYNNTVCTALEMNLNLYKKEYMRVRQKTQLQRHILCHIVDSIGIKDFVFRATVASHNLLPLVKLGEKQGRD